MISIRPVLFTLVLVFLLFDVGFGDPNASRRRTSMSASHGPAIMMPSRQPSTTHHIEVFTTGNSCKDSGCDFFNMAECGQAFIIVAGGSVCSQTQCYSRGFPKTPGVQRDAEWGANYPPQCFMIMQAIGTGPANWASMYNNNGAWGGGALVTGNNVLQMPNAFASALILLLLQHLLPQKLCARS